tara:strand:+ start:3908 stop:4057 length:150 start_codon:yes stop_codon:yes gene_type:complete
MKYGTILARNSKHQKAIKKIKTKIKKPINFIMLILLQINNKKKEYQNIL